MNIIDTTKLTQQQSQALPLLAVGELPSQVADSVDVSKQTVSEWLNKNEIFRQLLNIEREKIFSEVRGVFVGGVGKAMVEVMRLIEHGDSDHVRLKAAIYLVDKVDFDLMNYGGQGSSGDEIGEISLILGKFYGEEYEK